MAIDHNNYEELLGKLSKLGQLGRRLAEAAEPFCDSNNVLMSGEPGAPEGSGPTYLVVTAEDLRILRVACRNWNAEAG